MAQETKTEAENVDMTGVTLVPERPGCIQGPPARLARICAAFGFRNDCRKGSVYLTEAKMRRLVVQGARVVGLLPEAR